MRAVASRARELPSPGWLTSAQDDFVLVGDVPCSASVDQCFEEKMRAQLWGGQDGCDRGILSATTDRSWSTCQALHDYGFVTVGSPERARGSRAIAVATMASAAAASAAMAAGCEVNPSPVVRATAIHTRPQTMAAVTVKRP